MGEVKKRLIAEGKMAPAFTLLGSDGKRHSLKDYRGQNVLLYFYPKDDTPGCTKEACGFRDLKERFAEMDTVILGVSRDPLPSHVKFIEKHQLPFILLSDPEGSMMEKYGAWGEKNMYGKLSKGVIRSTVLVGPDGKVLQHWKQVRKAEQHPEEVLKMLRSL